jgi:hypothetical protein
MEIRVAKCPATKEEKSASLNQIREGTQGWKSIFIRKKGASAKGTE